MQEQSILMHRVLQNSYFGNSIKVSFKSLATLQVLGTKFDGFNCNWPWLT